MKFKLLLYFSGGTFSIIMPNCKTQERAEQKARDLIKALANIKNPSVNFIRAELQQRKNLRYRSTGLSWELKK